MKLMDYSLLLGIHDVEQAEQEEEEDEEDEEEELYHEDEDDDDENGLPPAPGSTSPQGIAGYMNSFKPMGPGEFDPYVDVYAVQSSVGEARTSTLFDFSKKCSCNTLKLLPHPGLQRLGSISPTLCCESLPCRCAPERGVFHGSD